MPTPTPPEFREQHASPSAFKRHGPLVCPLPWPNSSVVGGQEGLTVRTRSLLTACPSPTMLASFAPAVLHMSAFLLCAYEGSATMPAVSPELSAEVKALTGLPTRARFCVRPQLLTRV